MLWEVLVFFSVDLLDFWTGVILIPKWKVFSKTKEFKVLLTPDRLLVEGFKVFESLKDIYKNDEKKTLNKYTYIFHLYIFLYTLMIMIMIFCKIRVW